MAKMSREKGKRGEREVAELFREFGYEARRGQQFHGGGDSPDVRVEGLPLHVEVKRTETLSLYAAMQQAANDAEIGRVPTVWHKRNGRPWLVIMDARDFLENFQPKEAE